MKLRFSFLWLLSLIAVSCSYEESFFPEDDYDNSAVEFYATIDEQPDADTKVYADDQLRVLWNEDDRITIFSKFTYNQEYRFLGEDGDNAGAFRKVPNDDYVTGNDLSKSYAIYPYLESTKISNDGMITFTLPSEQIYHPDSFGIGANTMVSASETNELRFKNVGGYLSLKFYGEGVSISSITLKGNNGELLAGKCSIDMSSGLPVLSMDDSKATDTITLMCDPAVDLGNSSSEAIAFWFVLPPVYFTKGITVTVNTQDGGVFEKSTSNKLEIGRSAITKLGALEVVPEYEQPNNVIYYTSTDGEIVTPSRQDAFGASIISNEYVDGKGIITFDGDVTYIGRDAFFLRSKLTEISIPNSVTIIGNQAFFSCRSLTSITIPESVTSIESGAFAYCSFTDITIPDGVTSIGDGAFRGCESLVSFNGKYATSDGLFLIDQGHLLAAAAGALIGNLIIPEAVTSIGASAFERCLGLTDIIIPEGVLSIGASVFRGCRNLSSVTIPNSMTSIKAGAFYSCTSLTSFTGKFASSNGLFLIIDNCIVGVALGGVNGTVSIPQDVTTIGREAFSYCENLLSLSIPEGVTSLGIAAFSDCPNLTSVTIPSSVTTIDHNAFSRCQSLASITLLSTIPTPLPQQPVPDGMEAKADMFEYTNDCPIYVPEESVDAYKDAWSEYADRIQAIPVPVPEAIDLGLSVKWASFNVGATEPEELGDYFAWGEVETYYQDGEAQKVSGVSWKPGKEGGYYWPSYGFYEGSGHLTKYAYEDNSYGWWGFDGKTVLEVEDDVANVMFGDMWRMPTASEFEELANPDNCTWTKSTLNGVSGMIVRSKKSGFTDKWIFLPRVRSRYQTTLYSGDYSAYWSSSLSGDYPNSARMLSLNSDGSITVADAVTNRDHGLFVRPVKGGSIYLDKNTLDIEVEDEIYLIAEVFPSTTMNKDVTWSISNPAIASVNSSGKVTGLSPGTTIITATSSSYGKTATCKLTVSEKHESVQLWADGPYWATCNVGAETPSARGTLFTWGNIKGIDQYSYTLRDENYDSSRGAGLTEDIPANSTYYDAASYNWCRKWRIPTADEFRTLINADGSDLTVCTVNSDGLTITGKGAYSENSIFLPYYQRREDDWVYYYGNYWARTLDNETDAQNLYSEYSYYPESSFLTDRIISCQSSNRSFRYSIRPVHD